jgi:hypothetical protein
VLAEFREQKEHEKAASNRRRFLFNKEERRVEDENKLAII